MLTKFRSLPFAGKVLVIDGSLLLLLGLPQAINALIGHFLGIGLYKILNTMKLATLGIFETSCLLTIIGIILIRSSQEKSGFRFWNMMAALTHLAIALANIVLWNASYVVNQAERSGMIVTSIHLLFFFTELGIVLRKENAGRQG